MIDRLSGLWGPQTPLGLFLMENEITTLFFGGVNADQCVVCCSLVSNIDAILKRHYPYSPFVVVYVHRCIL